MYRLRVTWNALTTAETDTTDGRPAGAGQPENIIAYPPPAIGGEGKNISTRLDSPF